MIADRVLNQHGKNFKEMINNYTKNEDKYQEKLAEFTFGHKDGAERYYRRQRNIIDAPDIVIGPAKV